MMFADTSSAATAALQRAFAIERDVAERLLSEVPVLVKRAATPQVAAALLDTLQSMGAQVVLLPSTGAVLRPKEQAVREQPPPAPAPSPTWGGLDYQPQFVAPRASIEFDLALAREPRAESETTHANAPLASVVPLAQARQVDERVSGLIASSPGEFELDTSARAESFVGNGIPSLGDGYEEGARDAAFPDFDESGIPGLREAEPLARTSRLSTPLPGVLMSPQAELGLGTVPPLPSVRSAAPAKTKGPVPPPVPLAAQRGGPVGKQRPPPPPREALVSVPPARGASRDSSAVDLPALQLATPMKPPAPRATASPEAAHGPDTFWSGRRGPTATTEIADPVLAARAASVKSAREESKAFRTQPGEPMVPLAAAPQAAAKPAPRVARSFGLAAAEIALSALVLYLGVHFDNSVLYGNATPVSLLLHGFAFYGIGAGIAGMWPR